MGTSLWVALLLPGWTLRTKTGLHHEVSMGKVVTLILMGIALCFTQDAWSFTVKQGLLFNITWNLLMTCTDAESPYLQDQQNRTVNCLKTLDDVGVTRVNVKVMTWHVTGHILSLSNVPGAYEILGQKPTVNGTDQGFGMHCQYCKTNCDKCDKEGYKRYNASICAVYNCQDVKMLYDGHMVIVSKANIIHGRPSKMWRMFFFISHRTETVQRLALPIEQQQLNCKSVMHASVIREVILNISLSRGNVTSYDLRCAKWSNMMWPIPKLRLARDLGSLAAGAVGLGVGSLNAFDIETVRNKLSALGAEGGEAIKLLAHWAPRIGTSFREIAKGIANNWKWQNFTYENMFDMMQNVSTMAMDSKCVMWQTMINQQMLLFQIEWGRMLSSHWHSELQLPSNVWVMPISFHCEGITCTAILKTGHSLYPLDIWCPFVVLPMKINDTWWVPQIQGEWLDSQNYTVHSKTCSLWDSGWACPQTGRIPDPCPSHSWTMHVDAISQMALTFFKLDKLKLASLLTMIFWLTGIG